MSVYVDPLTQYGPESYHGDGRTLAARTGARNSHLWCHLFADDLDELHAFAAKLGLVRSWFQGDHYDLTPKRRAAAVAAGALRYRHLGGKRMIRKMDLESLIEASRLKVMTPAEKELQRRSFAYGNANIENERVTRETIELAAKAIEDDEHS